MAPSNGPPDPQTEDEPAVPPPPPGAPDGVVGVAPHATIISIRQSSRAFEPVNPSSAGPNSDEKVKAGTLDSVLSQAWTLRADEVIQNVTVYPDATCTATITVRTPTPAPTPPSVILRRLNGEQAAAAAANMCGPRPHLRGQRRCPLPAQLVTEIGPSGVLIGKLSNGDRLMIPVTDAGELSRVFVAADDTIAKRIVIRVVGAGERVCVHTRDQERWASVRMPQLSIVGTPRPAPRTTVGVVEYVRRRKNGDDGKSEGSGVDVAISPTPRPASVITIARPGTSLSESDRHGFEVTIEQIDRATVKVGAAGQNWLVEMEMFRAENRYVSLEPVTMSIGR